MGMYLGEFYFTSLKSGGLFGCAPHKPPFGLRSCEVLIIQPDRPPKASKKRKKTPRLPSTFRLPQLLPDHVAQALAADLGRGQQPAVLLP